MRKKLLSILLVLSLMLALVPAAFAADAVRTELESDGTTLAFYGSGVATADCWNGDWTAVTHVDLGYEIRGVAENVLARCVNLVSFEAIGSRYLRTYNGGLISIDGRQMLAAPNRCTAYEILDLVQTVKTGAFRYCQGLTAVTFPASLTTIEAQAFTSCLSLTDVQLPDGLKTIGDFAFAGCAALTSVLIPKSVTSIGAGAFTGIRGMAVYDGKLVISNVGVDGGYLLISDNPSQGFTKVATQSDLYNYPAVHYKDSVYGGGIWEIVEYNGSLYVAMCTGTPATRVGDNMRSFAIVRGTCSGDWNDPDAWTWTPVVGDQADGAKYTITSENGKLTLDTLTRDGFGDPFNHGLRAFAANDEQGWMVIGTANPFMGTQLWRTTVDMTDPMDRFTDLDPNGWDYPSIEYCVRHGLMSGMSDTIFSPNTVTTRA